VGLAREPVRAAGGGRSGQEKGKPKLNLAGGSRPGHEDLATNVLKEIGRLY
jgi:hypothetical protein